MYTLPFFNMKYASLQIRWCSRLIELRHIPLFIMIISKRTNRGFLSKGAFVLPFIDVLDGTPSFGKTTLFTAFIRKEKVPFFKQSKNILAYPSYKIPSPVYCACVPHNIGWDNTFRLRLNLAPFLQEWSLSRRPGEMRGSFTKSTRSNGALH